MTKLSPQYQAWRARMAEKYARKQYNIVGDVYAAGPAVTDFLAGAEAEHEAAKLVGRIEVLRNFYKFGKSSGLPAQMLDDAEARLDALLRGGGEE